MTPTLSRRHFLFGLVAMSVLPFGQEAKAAFAFEPFSFGYLTGSYLGTKLPDSYRLVQESQLFLQDAVKGLNRDKLDFVIFGGDNVEVPGKDDENWQLFIDIAQSLSCPWNFVLGEQDVSGKTPVDKMETYGRDWKGKGMTTNRSYWSYDPVDGIHVVGLDTSQPNLPTGQISDEQLAWLKKDMSANAGKFTIVVSHHPLLPPAPFDSGGIWDDYICPQGSSVREIMGAHDGVRLALSGHVHVNQIQQEKNVWYVSSPSLAVYPCAYRIFRVSPQAVTVETYQISFPALIKKARNQVEGWSLAYKYNPKIQAFCALLEGSKEDQNTRLSLTAPGKRSEASQPKHKRGKDEDDDKGKNRNKDKEKEKEKDKDKDKDKRKAKGSKSQASDSQKKETAPVAAPEPVNNATPVPDKDEKNASKAPADGQERMPDNGEPKASEPAK
ncbi:MAG TPA: metallophosphoesterase [Oculatellaceae cyanobacterium]